MNAGNINANNLQLYLLMMVILSIAVKHLRVIICNNNFVNTSVTVTATYIHVATEDFDYAADYVNNATY